MYTLQLAGRLTEENPATAVSDLTPHAQGWTNSTRAIGGYWTGDFTITPATMTRQQMAALFHSSIGRRVIEKTAGLVSWEGEIVQMTLTVGGVQYTISLDVERWHNRVQVDYGWDETAWSETTGSSDLYGESEYIDYLGGTYDDTAAQARRDRRLTENAYPRSRPSGGFASGSQVTPVEDGLHVMCAGYALGMNRRYQTADIAEANLSAQLTTLVGNSEFVTVGRIDANTLSVPVSVTGIESRHWDLVAELIGMGDASGNRYVGGVYADRLFYYQAAETAVTHYWRDGRLLNFGGAPMIPSLIKPDIVVRVGGAAGAVTPPGGNVWDQPDTVYIEEVEFTAPDSYRLIPAGGV